MKTNKGNFLIDLYNIMLNHYNLITNISNLSKEKQKIIYDNDIHIKLDKITGIYADIAKICIDESFPKE